MSKFSSQNLLGVLLQANIYLLFLSHSSCSKKSFLLTFIQFIGYSVTHAVDVERYMR